MLAPAPPGRPARSSARAASSFLACFPPRAAVNELAVEEEDFDALRESITTYDNFDQLALAGR